MYNLYIYYLAGKAVQYMNITDVRIRKVNDEGKMKAIVSITFRVFYSLNDKKSLRALKNARFSCQ